MELRRLFHVLVVSGSALGLNAGCSDAAGGGGGDGEEDDSAAAGGATTSTASQGAGGEGATGGGTVGTGGEPSSGGAGGGPSTGAGGVGGEAPLVCSGEGSPDDPCGCPCCWIGDCANDDECCGSFMKQGC